MEQTSEYTMAELPPYKGNPTIEILNDDGPLNKVTRKRFMFGCTKAKMLLDCIEVLKQFAFANDAERQNFKVPDNLPRRIKLVSNWKDETGQLRNEPYLLFEKGDDYLNLGVGAQRCQAIWELRGEIEDWVKKPN